MKENGEITHLGEPPTIAVGIQPKGNQRTPLGRPLLMLSLTIGTSQTQYAAYLCDADNYEEVAQKLYDGIMAAGKEAKRMQSGLVVAKGGSDALRAGKQGEVQHRPRAPREEGPPTAS